MKLAPKRRSWCCRSIAAKRKAIRSSLSLATQLKIFNDIHDSSINPILNLLTQVQICYVDINRCLSRDLMLGCPYVTCIWRLPVAVPVRFILYIKRGHLQIWIRTQAYGNRKRTFPSCHYHSASVWSNINVITYSRPY